MGQQRFNKGMESRGTRSVWAGEEKNLLQGATQVPVVHSVSFGYQDIDEWHGVALGQKEGHIYGRNSNPTVEVFAEKVRSLEGAEAAAAFSTGMAAISNALFALLSSGDRVVTIKDTYGGASKIFLDHLPRFQVDVAMCDTDDFDGIEAEIQKGCQILYLETPTNPTLKVIDLERMVRAARQQGALVFVDNTFATPINQNPLELGVDLVIHSATKFLGGHADALGGVICGAEEIVKRVNRFREIQGGALHPMAAYLLLRGMKTLHLRVRQQNESALAIARWLEQHPRVDEVFHPGLPSHPQHEIAAKQMRGYGGVFSFSLKGGIDAVRAFLPSLRYAHLAANLGSVETVAAPPRTSSHLECSEEERRSMGIPEGLIRYSVGIEETDDLLSDLKQALDRLPERIGAPS